MELAKVAVFQHTKTGRQYTRIRVYEPFFVHRGPDFIVNLCLKYYPSPYYFVIFDENNIRELDYGNSGINIKDLAWQMVSPAEANLMLE